MRTALLLTAAFILGVGAGFLLSHSVRPEMARNLEQGSAVSPAREDRPEAAVSRLAAELSEDPTGTPAGATGILPPAKESGSGVIAGSVRTGDGEPVPGARIRVSRSFPGSGEQWDRVDRETRTGDSGEFRLGGLATASHSVEAFLDGYEISPDPNMKMDVRDVWPDAFISFIARPVIPLPIEIVLPDGSTPETAVIECVRRSSLAGNRHRRAWSHRDPVLYLAPGFYELTAHHGRDRGLRSDPVGVDLRAGETPSSVTLRLEARPGVRGRVIFPDGEEADSVRVHALHWSAPVPPSFRDFHVGGTSAAAHRADGHSYVIEDLPPGRYLLGTGRSSEEIETVEEVEVDDRMAVKDIVLPPLDPSAYVVLLVLDPRGEPYTDIRLHAGCSSESGSFNTRVTPIRRPDGSLWVLHHRAEQCGREGNDVVFHITIGSARYGTRRVRYRLPIEEPLVVQFSEPASLEVLVEGYAGSGHEGWVHLDLQRRETDEEGAQNPIYVGVPGGEIDLRGRAMFSRIESGEYELAIKLKTGPYSTIQLASETVTVLGGRNEVTVPLPPLHDLAVQTEGESIRLNLRRLAGQGGDAPGFQMNGVPADPAGLVTFERIPAGRYQLTAGGGGPSGEMLVDVPAAPLVYFRPLPLDAMRVEISDPVGYLAGAGFRSGDRIIGIDGTAFENEIQMRALMDGAAIKEQVVLTVLRHGSRIELPFDPRMQRKYRELGGSLLPSSR